MWYSLYKNKKKKDATGLKLFSPFLICFQTLSWWTAKYYWFSLTTVRSCRPLPRFHFKASKLGKDFPQEFQPSAKTVAPQQNCINRSGKAVRKCLQKNSVGKAVLFHSLVQTSEDMLPVIFQWREESLLQLSLQQSFWHIKGVPRSLPHTEHDLNDLISTRNCFNLWGRIDSKDCKGGLKLSLHLPLFNLGVASSVLSTLNPSTRFWLGSVTVK